MAPHTASVKVSLLSIMISTLLAGGGGVLRVSSEYQMPSATCHPSAAAHNSASALDITDKLRDSTST